MCDLNKKEAFTLIEIIVVLIILGVLAAIAVPNLFSNIYKAKSAEALITQGMINKQLTVCLLRFPDVWDDSCNLDSTSSAPNSYSIYTPSGSRFKYQVDGQNNGASGNWQYHIRIYDGSTLVLHIHRNPAGHITCTAQDPFNSLC